MTKLSTPTKPTAAEQLKALTALVELHLHELVAVRKLMEEHGDSAQFRRFFAMWAGEAIADLQKGCGIKG